MVFDEKASFGVNYYFGKRNRVRYGITPGDKGYRIFSREHDADEETWSVLIPVRAQAMVLTKDKLFFAGPPDVVPDEDPAASFEGRLGAVLWVVSKSTGENLGAYILDDPPVFDGMIALSGRLYLTTSTGHIMCLAGSVKSQM